MAINRYILSFIGIVLAILVGVILLSPASTPFSPLGSPESMTKATLSTSTKYIVLGFVPYWNLKKLSPTALSNVTDLAYFNLHLDKNGKIYTHVNRREEDPSYTNYKRILNGTIDVSGKPLTMTFMPIDQDALTAILSSAATRTTAIQTIENVLSEIHATGVNIDFEPLGDTPPSLRDSFTSFIQQLRTSLQSATHQLLSISIYPSAMNRPRIWDLKNLAPLTDYFVVMTYDYTMPVTDNAGPNSPLRGSGDLFNNDIVKNIAEITSAVPTEKILLGIPFYGYEWKTIDGSKYSATTARGSVASLERIQTMLRDQTLESLWDYNTLTPYGIASVSGQTTQIYYENETSIGLKLEFVKTAHLGGIAIWALGYEGDNPSLWKVISSLNH